VVAVLEHDDIILGCSRRGNRDESERQQDDQSDERHAANPGDIRLMSHHHFTLSAIRPVEEISSRGLPGELDALRDAVEASEPLKRYWDNPL
jgi:hypothetical protein